MAKEIAGRGPGRGGKGGERHGGSRGPRQPVSIKKGGAVSRKPAGRGPERPSVRPNARPSVRPSAAGAEKAGGDAFKPHYKPGSFKGKPRTGPSAPGSEKTGGEAFKPYHKPGEFKGKPRTRPQPPREPLREQPREPLPKAPEPTPHGAEDKVTGINPVLELLRAGGRPVDALYIDKDKGGKQFGELVSLAKKKGIPVKVAPRAALDGMSGGLRHQGAVAVVSPKEYADPYGLVEKALAKGKLPLLLILDGIEDPQNLGAIIRTAESAGVDGVIIPEHRAAHLSSAVARASAGALEHMPVAKVYNIAGFIEFLKQKSFWILGLAGEAEQDYTAFDMNLPLAVVLGSEGSGIRPLVRKSCDALVSLPMLGKVSSLNVSVAAGIMLYEIIRQRKIR